MASWEEHCKRRGIPFTPATREPEPERSRADSGQFVGDDPSTPEVNEAWKGGKSPAKKKATDTKKLPSIPKSSAKKKSTTKKKK